MASKSALTFCGTVCLVLPWLMGATPGSVTQIGSWVTSAVVLAVVLGFQISGALQPSLLVAAAVSLCLAWLQYFGVSDIVPCMAAAAAGEMLGNLRQRNQLASLLVMGWLVLLVWRVEERRWFLLVCVLAALLGLGNALSGSRTGLMQWMAVAGLGLRYLSLNGNSVLTRLGPLDVEKRWILGAGLLGYVLGVLAAPWLAQLAGHGNAGLLSRLGDTGGSGRVALWGNVLELIAQKPILGHGWRSLAYAHYSSDFSGARFMEMPDNAHNLPLHLAVELGLPVALAFCGLVGWLVWRNKPWNETRSDRQLAWGVLLVIGIHSLLEYPLWYGPFFMTTLIAIGVLCADLWKKWQLAGTDTAQNAIILGVRALAVLLLVGTAFVAFDYHRVSQIYLQPEQRSSWYAADPLAAAKQSVLFQPQAKFAELQITQLSKETAPRVLELSSELIHWSPEPRIIEKLIESAVMMGLDDLAMFHLQRYRLNYPAAHALWSQRVQ